MKKIRYLVMVIVITALFFVTVGFAQNVKREPPIQANKTKVIHGTVSGSPLEIPKPPKGSGTISGSPLEIPKPPKTRLRMRQGQ